jgi:hypothetical protein
MEEVPVAILLTGRLRIGRATEGFQETAGRAEAGIATAAHHDHRLAMIQDEPITVGTAALRSSHHPYLRIYLRHHSNLVLLTTTIYGTALAVDARKLPTNVGAASTNPRGLIDDPASLARLISGL